MSVGMQGKMSDSSKHKTSQYFVEKRTNHYMGHVVHKILSPYVWTKQIFFENVHDILVKTHLD